MKTDSDLQSDVVQERASLEGTVDWQYQKDAAARCVRFLMGVVAVSNEIAIKPRAAPGVTSVRNDLSVIP